MMMNPILSRINLTAYRNYAKQHFPNLLKPRPADSHKGTFGSIGVLGGAEGMMGSALLAGTAALYTGCGKVVVAFPQDKLPIAVHHPYPELMLDTAERAVHRTDIDVWLAGCGLGKDEKAAKLVHTVWQSGRPCLVLDADALHILVDYPQLFLKNTRNDMVLTPHPGEAAYLLNTTVQQVQSHRDWAARELANRYHCWVVLKGHNTVISSARGFLHTNTTGNTGLATAGSGDVLAGMITSLLAQGIKAAEAVPAAVWLHGAAAELLEQSQVGPIGLLAGELAEMLRWLRNRLTAAATE